MNQQPLVSIIVPTYNERDNIIFLIKNISKILISHQILFEIIVVDDNSPDGTYANIKDKFLLNPLIRPFKRLKNLGLATAILYGICRARGSIIIGMDADFNHPPSLIPQLIGALDQSDFAVASRFIKGGSMKEPIRNLFTYIFNLFLKYFLGFPILDNLSGFYAIKKQTLYELPLKYIFQGYGEYHLRLLKSMQWRGLYISEIPVKYGRRRYGKSKSSLLTLFFRYVWIALQLALRIKK